MIAETLACLLLVLVVAAGLSRPVVDRMGLAPAEALAAGALLSLVAAWAIDWAVFTTGCPLSGYWAAPALAAAFLVAGRRALAAILRELSGNATFRIPEGQLLCIEEDIAALSEDMRQYARIVRPAD